MNKTVSFIPIQDSVKGSRVWVINPDDRMIDTGVGTPLPIDFAVPQVERRQRSTAGLSDWQTKKIARYIDAHIDAKLRIVDLSEQVRLSVSRFSKGFNVTFGRPPYDYVLSRRIEAAKYLIASTEEPLSQIAHACGLSDQAHLSKVFKRIVGTTPLKWRRNSTVGRAAQWEYLAAGARRISQGFSAVPAI